ncbi:MAG: DUF1194 domain-containing protein [Pseudomonadota bacterium]
MILKLLFSLIGSILLFAGFSNKAAAATEVFVELVLAVDCSSSVNEEEFELQMLGLSQAFAHPDIHAAFEQAGEKGIAVALLQWSGEADQIRSIEWHHVFDAVTVQNFANILLDTPRQAVGGATALGDAILESATWIHGNDFLGERQVIDVSGDGQNNQGEPAKSARDQALKSGVTFNGLAILNEDQRLGEYYVENVVAGPGSFLITAGDFEDFARAIRKKIFFEITGPPIATYDSLEDTAAFPTNSEKIEVKSRRTDQILL